MAYDQLLHLSQVLHLSPTLLQSMNILQMNTMELRDYLNELSLENPAMEDAGDPFPSWEEFAERIPWLADSTSPSFDGDMGQIAAAASELDSLPFLLKEQLDRLQLLPEAQALCYHLADCLDDQGQLDEDDLHALLRLGVPEALLDECIRTLQSLEPAGVGARSTEECLVLQLSRLPGDHTLAIRICQKYLPLLARQQYKTIARTLSASEQDIRSAEQVIQSLSPNPVSDYSPSTPVEIIRPDAWVAEIDGKLQVFINQWDLPHFSISEHYQHLAGTTRDSETETYLRHKIQQARWVLECVRRRENTLLTCLTAVVDAQSDFFLGKHSAPAPLLRKELAKKLEVHPSTVTRTLGRKYIQCQQGLFPTSYFFSRKTGGEHSDQAILQEIARLIQAEDSKHPYSDQVLCSLLEQNGIHLSRRTVAKYRDSLHIPSSFQRKSTSARRR